MMSLSKPKLVTAKISKSWRRDNGILGRGRREEGGASNPITNKRNNIHRGFFLV